MLSSTIQEGPRSNMRLEIFIGPDCSGCEEARAIAQEIQASFPAVEVKLIELDEHHPVPPQVVAVPTYLLDGVVISLGNPRRAALIKEITRRQGWRT